MKPARAILVFWISVILVLLFVEFAEITRLFTLPVQSALGNLLSFIFALVFTTFLALVGAIFIGIYISHRLQAPGEFTPFEEEMLKMRSDVQSLRADVAELKGSIGPAHPVGPDPPRTPE
ncbi:MAG TPA: hypothetical protein VIZ68_03610 [Thermoplasmata archaeon]